MRIIWDPVFKQFETHADSGSLGSDVEALKSAGWKTEGPPEWKWVSFRAVPLTKLKSARLASGLGITITPAALTQYNRLKEQDDTNAAVLKQLKEAKKEQKKSEAESGPEIDWGHVEPGESKILIQYVPPPPPSLLCSVCRTPVYYYESQDPPICLDCEFEEF